MKGLVFLGLVGATIYGALVLSSHYLLSRDPAENALAGQSLGNPMRSWGTDLPSLASSSSQESALPLTQPAVAPASTSHSASSAAATPQADGTAYQPSEWPRSS
jgi:hypothetical protein